jgi:hypothetical protein
MSVITTVENEAGHVVVTARSSHAAGRIVLSDDGMVVLEGDFSGRSIPVAVLDLLVRALDEAGRHTASPRVPEDAVLVARCVTADSVDDYADDAEWAQDWPGVDRAVAPPQPADIVITIDGGDGLPISTYALSTNPLDMFGDDPQEVLLRNGWRVVADRGVDDWNYRLLVVERNPS